MGIIRRDKTSYDNQWYYITVALKEMRNPLCLKQLVGWLIESLLIASGKPVPNKMGSSLPLAILE